MAPAPSTARRTEKSAAAFRTISEVADELDVQQHVLRFWETKFSQVRPLKRGGGRRYYRPEDVQLLKRIRELLYDDGYTIKGVQRLLRDGSLKAATIATVKRAHALKEPEPQPTAPAPEQPRAAEPVQNGPVQADAVQPVTEQQAPAAAGPDEALRGELKEILAELKALRSMLPDRSS